MPTVRRDVQELVEHRGSKRALEPYLDPTEHLQAVVRRQVRDYGPADAGDLARFVGNVWKAIPPKTVDDIVLFCEAKKCAKIRRRTGT